MKELTAREKVLKNVRNALLHKAARKYGQVDYDTLVYKPMDDLPEICFAQQFTLNKGTFIFCESEQEAVENFKYLCNENQWSNISSSSSLINTSKQTAVQVQVVSCQSLIARTGSIVLHETQLEKVISDQLVVIAYTHQLVSEIAELFYNTSDKQNFIFNSHTHFISSPNNQIKGLYLFLIDN